MFMSSERCLGGSAYAHHDIYNLQMITVLAVSGMNISSFLAVSAPVKILNVWFLVALASEALKKSVLANLKAVAIVICGP